MKLHTDTHSHTHSEDNLNNHPKVLYGNVAHYYIFKNNSFPLIYTAIAIARVFFFLIKNYMCDLWD